YQEDNLILMYIEFGMAQKYIDDLSKNVKRGLKMKVEKGWKPGLAPIGYINNKYSDKGEKRIIKDPERFNLVRKMWDLMLTGAKTPPKIAEIANNSWGFRTRKLKRVGDKPLSRSAVYRMFTNPFYFGMFEYNGRLYRGNHQPLITVEEYDKVQKLLGKKGRLKPQSRTFPFTGMITCGECGCFVTAEEKHQIICSHCKFKFSRLHSDRCPRCGTLIEKIKDPKLLDYTYYHCTKRKRGKKCSQPSIRKEDLEKQVVHCLSHIEISEEFKNWALKYLRETHDKETGVRTNIYQSLQKAYNQAQRELDRLLGLKLRELITDEEYFRKKGELLKDQKRLKEKLEDTEHRAGYWIELSEKTFIFARYARKWFKEGTLEDKKIILDTIGSNLILKDKKLFIDTKKPFFFIKKGLRISPGLKAGFEPAKNRINKGETPAFSTPDLTRRGIVDDVRTYWMTKKEYFEIPDLRVPKAA
ncbi:MAG: recombinase family protein, partial [candidate division Zixibacteria bacterium]|nr:recombinase family protein [candidate division Zixibacteria bacterium]